MPKLTRTLVLGAMLAVMSSATAAVAQEPTASDQAVQQFRAGERSTQGQPVSPDQAVQRFRAGERSSQAQAASESGGSTLAQQRRWYYESTRVHPAAPSSQPADRGTPVALLTALAAAAGRALSLDALSVRRKTRRSAAHPAT